MNKFVGIAFSLFLVACGDNSPAPQDATSTNTFTVSIDKVTDTHQVGDDGSDHDCDPPDAQPATTTKPCEEVCAFPATDFVCDHNSEAWACCSCTLPNGHVVGCKNNFSTSIECPL